ncbi:MAG: glycosyltransferase family 4 protein [Acidimicrobiales bacterium]
MASPDRQQSVVRVAYLTGEYPRASDVWIQREISSLRDLGVIVDTFSVRRPAEAHSVGNEQRTERKRTTYLLDRLRSVAALSTHARLAIGSPKRYWRGLELALETRRPGLAGLAYQAAYFAEAGLLAEELRKRGIPHLHNHFGDSSCTVAMLAAQLSGVTFSFTLHSPGVFYDPRAWRLDAKIERAAFCTCISKYCRAQATIHATLEQHDRLHIVHCGVHPNAYTPVTHEGGGRRVLFVGRLADLKGVTVLLAALQRVKKERPDVELTIVGDGPDRARFEDVAEDLDVADRVSFVGYRSQAEVADHLAETDVFVLPSFAEGVPVTLMEAMASGVPVVATRVGGVAELVDDGTNGSLVEAGDAVSLADAILALLNDPSTRNRFGEAGRATVVSDFSNKTEAARLRELFASVGS